MAPQFLIIGAAKAATTSMSSLLATHPSIGMVRGKEPHFFSMDARYAQGWPRYLGLYQHCLDKAVRGDASTSYSRLRYHPHTIARIQKHVPDARIIYMVRHPIKRMESAYIEHLCTPGRPVYASINDAVSREPMIVDSSRYAEVFESYRSAFGAERVKVVWFEEYIRRPVDVLQEVCRFLDVDDTFVPNMANERMNSAVNAPGRLSAMGRGHLQIDLAWDPKIRQGVLDSIKDDSDRFLSHFGRSADHWDGLFN